MPALHPLAAMPAPAHVNSKLDPFHLGLRYLGLILLLDLGLFQISATVRATTRQFALQRLVNRKGDRTATTPAIPGSRFPPRLGRMGLRLVTRERRRLTLPGPLRLFQGALQPFHSALQFLYPELHSLVGGLQLRHFLPRSSVFLNQRLHSLRLPVPKVGSSTSLGIASRR